MCLDEHQLKILLKTHYFVIWRIPYRRVGEITSLTRSLTVVKNQVNWHARECILSEDDKKLNPARENDYTTVNQRT